MYNNVVKVGSKGPTSVVTQGLELLSTVQELEQGTIKIWDLKTGVEARDKLIYFVKKTIENGNNDLMTDHTDLLAENNELKNEVERLTIALQKAPDPVELVELRANLTGLQKLLEEKDNRIEDLTKAVDILNAFANYFKTESLNK